MLIILVISLAFYLVGVAWAAYYREVSAMWFTVMAAVTLYLFSAAFGSGVLN